MGRPWLRELALPPKDSDRGDFHATGGSRTPPAARQPDRGDGAPAPTTRAPRHPGAGDRRRVHRSGAQPLAVPDRVGEHTRILDATQGVFVDNLRELAT
jgi:hypothetical protein